MKKVAFLVASAVMAGAAYCSQVGDRLFSSNLKTGTESVKQQQQQDPLVLEKSAPTSNLLADHYSHSSHSSHSSHRSHYSSR